MRLTIAIYIFSVVSATGEPPTKSAHSLIIKIIVRVLLKIETRRHASFFTHASSQVIHRDNLQNVKQWTNSPWCEAFKIQLLSAIVEEEAFSGPLSPTLGTGSE